MSNFNAVSTVVGNLVADPELRYIPNSNVPVLNCRIASTPRKFNKQTNQWEDGEPLYLTVNAFRSLAENAANSLSKGMRVVVVGNLTQRSYQTKDGDNRSVYEIEAEAIGPDLTFATAIVSRNVGGGGGSPAPQGGGFNAPQGGGQTGGFGGGGGQQGGFGGQQGGFAGNQRGGFGN